MANQEHEGRRRLSDVELLQLKRWNTPTIYNGWEQITRHDAGKDGFNLEEVHDFMPHQGPMVGYAVTLVIEPSNPEHRRKNANAWSEYRAYVAGTAGPKIVVVEDLDKPRVMGALWGEVASTCHRALGCIGTITDGGIRDLDEMNSVGFKALARRLCVGHAYVAPVLWGGEVEVFGRKVQPGQLIHADKHGFLVVPPEDEALLLEAARFMDDNECRTVLAAARASTGKSTAEILADLETSVAEFTRQRSWPFQPQGRVALTMPTPRTLSVWRGPGNASFSAGTDGRRIRVARRLSCRHANRAGLAAHKLYLTKWVIDSLTVLHSVELLILFMPSTKPAPNISLYKPDNGSLMSVFINPLGTRNITPTFINRCRLIISRLFFNCNGLPVKYEYPISRKLKVFSRYLFFTQ